MIRAGPDCPNILVLLRRPGVSGGLYWVRLGCNRMGLMSVLVVPTRYMPNVGGIETLLRHTLPLLRDQGYDPVIVTEVP